MSAAVQRRAGTLPRLGHARAGQSSHRQNPSGLDQHRAAQPAAGSSQSFVSSQPATAPRAGALCPPQHLTAGSWLTSTQSHACIKLGRKEGTALHDALLPCLRRKATLRSLLQTRWEVESHGHSAGHLCLRGWARGCGISCSQLGNKHLLCPFSASKGLPGPISTHKSSSPTTPGTQPCGMQGGTLSRHLRGLIILKESKSAPGSSGMNSTHLSPTHPTHHPQVSKVSPVKPEAAQRALPSPWAHLSRHGTKPQHMALLNASKQHAREPEYALRRAPRCSPAGTQAEQRVRLKPAGRKQQQQLL